VHRLRLVESTANGSIHETAAVALRMVRMDRFAEAPRYALLGTFAEQGDFAAACRHYEAFARLLWRSFGMHPSSGMQQFFRDCADRCNWTRGATAASPPSRRRA
jgi:two-component SAPR family response regulator